MDKLDKILQKKESLNAQLLELLETISIGSYNNLLKEGFSFFINFENYVVDESKNAKAKAQQEDLLISIKNVFDFSLYYFDALEKISTQLNVQLLKPQTFLNTSQKLYRTYRKKDAEKYKLSFERIGLSTDGFNSKHQIKMGIKHYDLLPLIIGLALLIVSGLLSYFVNIDTGVKYLFLRILFSLSVALIMLGLCKDFIEIKMHIKTKHRKLAIIAFGAIAIYLITYFFNPPRPPEYHTKSELEQEKK